jgi:hypothetical protein
MTLKNRCREPIGYWIKNGRYFLKFADDTYGRIHFKIDGASDSRPLYMESWLNLKPGSRNLATDKLIIGEIKSMESDR